MAILGFAGLVMVSPLYGVIAALPAIASDFRVDATEVSWIGFTFGFAYASSSLLFGPLSDLVGRRTILVCGLAGSAITTSAVALSPNLEVLYATRAAAGFCAGTFGPISLSWITDRYSGTTRANGIAVVSVGLIGAGTVGQMVFGAMPFGWRASFLLFAALDLLCSVAVAWIVRDVVEARASRSLAAIYEAEFGLLEHPQIPTLYVLGFLLYGGFVAFYVSLANFLTQHGFTAAQVTAVRALGLPGMILSVLTGRLIAKIGARTVALCGILIFVTGLALCAATSRSLSTVILMSAVYVLGFAFAAVAVNNLVTRLAGSVRGSAVAFFVFISFFGASISVPFASALRTTPFSLFVGALAAASAAVGALLALVVKPEGAQPPSQPPAARSSGAERTA